MGIELGNMQVYIRGYIGDHVDGWDCSLEKVEVSVSLEDITPNAKRQVSMYDHLGVSEYSWYSQLSRLRKFSTGTLSSTLLDPFRNFRTRLSRSNWNLVQISRTVPWATERVAFSLPSLQMARPELLTTAICSSHPPKKEFLRTLPITLASLITFSLTPAFITFGASTVFLPIICSFSATILANRQQYWLTKWVSFSFLGLAARKTYYLPTVSLIFRLPDWVGSIIILALLMSYSGSDLYPSASEFSLNQSHFSHQMFMPLVEGVSTQYRSLTSFLSLRRTVARRALGGGSFCSLLRPRSRETKPKGISSWRQALLGDGTSCIFIQGTILALGWTGTSSSEEEELPNYIFLFFIAYCLRAMRSCLYFSLSVLKRLSCCFGELPDESVLPSASITQFSLIRTGCFCACGASSSEDEDFPNYCLRSCCASRCLAFRSARQSARCFLKSSAGGAGGAGASQVENRLRFWAIRLLGGSQYNIQ